MDSGDYVDDESWMKNKHRPTPIRRRRPTIAAMPLIVSGPEPLYIIDLRRTIGGEYAGMFEDMARMLCIQFVLQIMLYFGGIVDAVFTDEYFVLVMYILLGVMFYWLILKSLVGFRPSFWACEDDGIDDV